MGCQSSQPANASDENSPDADFHADSLIKLTHGVTAYRLIEPVNPAPDVPTIICLHGFSNCSYMWADVSDLLTNFDQGPCARVLVFDFYGRGRSPWTGVNITLDTLVTQTKELMDYLGLKSAASFIGYDLGGAVAAGFAAKYPTLCSSLALLSPVGIKYKSPLNEKILNQDYFGEYLMYKQRNTYPDIQEQHFYDRDSAAPHRSLVNQEIAMCRWQIANTPGYLGAILSTFRYFPIRGMEELFAAIGRHPRKTMIIWGDHDVVCPFRKCITVIEESFPKGIILDILECGHNCVAEKFEDVVRELLSFHKGTFELKI